MKALIFVLLAFTFASCEKRNACGTCTEMTRKTPAIGLGYTRFVYFEACGKDFREWDGKQSSSMSGDTSIVITVTCEYD